MQCEKLNKPLPLFCIFLNKNHRTTEYPELEVTHRDHQSPALIPALDTPKNHSMCLRPISKHLKMAELVWGGKKTTRTKQANKNNNKTKTKKQPAPSSQKILETLYF